MAFTGVVMAGRAHPIDVTPDTAAIRSHVRSIIDSPVFKGSRRSQEFLQFIVERALDRHPGDLKERTLGVELFGRSPTYDTGEDAIVRVTACDVRKRLQQFYSDNGHRFPLRVELPTGSYIPEFRQLDPEPPVPDALETTHLPVGSAAEIKQARPTEAPLLRRDDTRPFLKAGGLLGTALAAFVLLGAALWAWNMRRQVETPSSPLKTLPWTALLQAGRELHVIFCDPEIVMVQRLLNYSVSLSDYANRRYWPADIPSDKAPVFQAISFRGVSVAAVDSGIALRIEAMLGRAGRRPIQIHTARSFRLADFKTEDSFVLFGSPRSNPWVNLFADQLDFSFEFDPMRKVEFIRNRHPRAGEPLTYVPTAEGWGTGNAYAVVALVGNPGQHGQVLLIAGSNAEATEAAGKLAMSPEVLLTTLRTHGVNPNGPARQFEILLRVAIMAGSPNTFEVVACHALGDPH